MPQTILLNTQRPHMVTFEAVMVSAGASRILLGGPAIVRIETVSALSYLCSRSSTSAAAGTTASTQPLGSAAASLNASGNRDTTGAGSVLPNPEAGGIGVAAAEALVESFVGTAATSVAAARRTTARTPAISATTYPAAAAAAAGILHVSQQDDTHSWRSRPCSCRTSKQWQRGSPFRGVCLVQLLMLCAMFDMALVFVSPVALNARRAPTCCAAVLTAERSPAIAAVTRTHAAGAGVATDSRPYFPSQGSSSNSKRTCLGHKQLHTHKAVSQRSLCALRDAVPSLAGEEGTTVGGCCSPPPVSRHNMESAVPVGAQTGTAAPATRTGQEFQRCNSCVPSLSSRWSWRALPAQERRCTGTNDVGRDRQRYVHPRVYRRGQLPQTQGKRRRGSRRRLPSSWLLLVQPPSVTAEASHAVSHHEPRTCQYAYTCGTHVEIVHNTTAPLDPYRRCICSSPLVEIKKSSERRRAGGSDTKTRRGRGEGASRRCACVGGSGWTGCSRTLHSDTPCKKTCSTFRRGESSATPFINNIARENCWATCNRAGTGGGAGAGPGYLLLVQQQQEVKERPAFFSSRLHAKRPRAKAEKRAKNYQRAYEEQRRREQQQLNQQQQRQRQQLEQQEEAERQRAQQRRLSGKEEDAEERGSAAGGSATLTQLMEEARAAAGEVIEHRENFVVVGSTQRRVHGRRPPNIQRYENQPEFVKSVFEQLPISEEELQTEILKAERAWRGDMMLDELEAEIGGPDALAPGGIGTLAH